MSCDRKFEHKMQAHSVFKLSSTPLISLITSKILEDVKNYTCYLNIMPELILVSYVQSEKEIENSVQN